MEFDCSGLGEKQIGLKLGYFSGAEHFRGMYEFDKLAGVHDKATGSSGSAPMARSGSGASHMAKVCDVPAELRHLAQSETGSGEASLADSKGASGATIRRPIAVTSEQLRMDGNNCMCSLSASRATEEPAAGGHSGYPSHLGLLDAILNRQFVRRQNDICLQARLSVEIN